MDLYARLSALTNLAGSFGITIRRVPSSGDPAGHPGGAFVRLKGKEILFLDPTAPVTDQIDVVAAALRDRKELQDMFVPPEIRELLEEGSGGR